MQEAKKNPKVKTQTTLDEVVGKGTRSQAFTRGGVLHAVSQFVACDDQV